jgi:hypothetical protein
VLKDEVQLISKADRSGSLYQVSRDAVRCCDAGCSMCGECVCVVSVCSVTHAVCADAGRRQGQVDCIAAGWAQGAA